jgi:signal peptidase I
VQAEPVERAIEATEVEEEAGSGTRTVLEWIAIVAGALVAALVIKVFLFQAFVIPSESMETTLMIRDRVLVNKLSYRLHDIDRGDVVVFERPPAARDGTDDSDLIKRVIGLPGERIEGRDQAIYINGVELEEPWLPEGEVPTMFDFGPVTIPEDQIFVLGDNRDDSKDSRFIGAVDTDLVVGRAFLRWWPLGRAGGL